MTLRSHIVIERTYGQYKVDGVSDGKHGMVCVRVELQFYGPIDTCLAALADAANVLAADGVHRDTMTVAFSSGYAKIFGYREETPAETAIRYGDKVAALETQLHELDGQYAAEMSDYTLERERLMGLIEKIKGEV